MYGPEQRMRCALCSRERRKKTSGLRFVMDSVQISAQGSAETGLLPIIFFLFRRIRSRI